MNKLQEMTFGDNDFIKWYESLSKKEQEEVWKEIKKHMEENLSNTLSSIYKIGEK